MKLFYRMIFLKINSIIVIKNYNEKENRLKKQREKIIKELKGELNQIINANIIFLRKAFISLNFEKNIKLYKVIINKNIIIIIIILIIFLIYIYNI